MDGLTAWAMGARASQVISHQVLMGRRAETSDDRAVIKHKDLPKTKLSRVFLVESDVDLESSLCELESCFLWTADVPVLTDGVNVVTDGGKPLRLPGIQLPLGLRAFEKLAILALGTRTPARRRRKGEESESEEEAEELVVTSTRKERPSCLSQKELQRQLLYKSYGKSARVPDRSGVRSHRPGVV